MSNWKSSQYTEDKLDNIGCRLHSQMTKGFTLSTLWHWQCCHLL